jgi:hypothetical protein
MISNCQYCFRDYKECSCCKYCGYIKGTCVCHLEGEYPCTKFHPTDIYRQLNDNPDVCAVWMDMHTLEDADKFIMKMYTEDCWPERLKNEHVKKS